MTYKHAYAHVVLQANDRSALHWYPAQPERLYISYDKSTSVLSTQGIEERHLQTRQSLMTEGTAIYMADTVKGRMRMNHQQHHPISTRGLGPGTTTPSTASEEIIHRRDLSTILGEWNPLKWYILVKTYEDSFLKEIFNQMEYYLRIYSSRHCEPADEEDIGHLPISIQTGISQQDTQVLIKDEEFKPNELKGRKKHHCIHKPLRNGTLNELDTDDTEICICTAARLLQRTLASYAVRHKDRNFMTARSITTFLQKTTPKVCFTMPEGTAQVVTPIPGHRSYMVQIVTMISGYRSYVEKLFVSWYYKSWIGPKVSPSTFSYELGTLTRSDTMGLGPIKHIDIKVSISHMDSIGTNLNTLVSSKLESISKSLEQVLAYSELAKRDKAWNTVTLQRVEAKAIVGDILLLQSITESLQMELSTII